MGNFFSIAWNTVFFYPFLNFLMVLYHVLGDNLGFSVIALAFVTRVILIPSTRSQMDMVQKMAVLRPRLDELNKKYKHNQEKLAKEQVKLYQEVGYNPLGCVASLVPQLVILIAVVNVIRVVTNNSLEGLYPVVKNFVFGSVDTPQISTAFWVLDLAKNYTQVAKDNGQSVYFALSGAWYFVLALLVGLTQFISTKFMQAFQGTNMSTASSGAKANKDEPMSPEEMQNMSTQMMNSTFPLLTAFISLSTPAVLGVYWVVQSVLFVVQYFVLDYKKSLQITKSMLDFSWVREIKMPSFGSKQEAKS